MAGVAGAESEKQQVVDELLVPVMWSHCEESRVLMWKSPIPKALSLMCFGMNIKIISTY